eukprot:4808405-Pleurochrysis_carterae.AAC.1
MSRSLSCCSRRHAATRRACIVAADAARRTRAALSACARLSRRRYDATTSAKAGDEKSDVCARKGDTRINTVLRDAFADERVAIGCARVSKRMRRRERTCTGLRVHARGQLKRAYRCHALESETAHRTRTCACKRKRVSPQRA